MGAAAAFSEGDKAGCLCSVIYTSLHAQVREYISKKVLPEEPPAQKLLDRGGEGLVSSQHQWQFNLLTHVESLQDEVTHRMDSIEKELDGRVPFLKSVLSLSSEAHSLAVQGSCLFASSAPSRLALPSVRTNVT